MKKLPPINHSLCSNKTVFFLIIYLIKLAMLAMLAMTCPVDMQSSTILIDCDVKNWICYKEGIMLEESTQHLRLL